MIASVSRLAFASFLALAAPPAVSLACDCSRVDPAIDAAIQTRSFDEAERLAVQAIARTDSRDAHLCRAVVLLSKGAREVANVDLPPKGPPADWTGTPGDAKNGDLERMLHSETELDPALTSAASEELETVIARWPDDPAAHRCALQVELARRDHPAFLGALRRAGESLRPLGAETAVDELLPYPLRYADRKEYAKAAESYRTLIEVYPLSAKLHSSYGAVLMLQGELDAGAARFAVAFDLDPHDPLVLGNAADAALYRRDFAGARRFYELLLRDSPGATGRYFDLAAIALERGPQAAIPAWKRYLAQHAVASDDGIWVQLATDILAKLENPATSREIDAIARDLIAAGAPAQAIPVLVGAAKREPGNPIHRFLLAQAYERGGFASIALEELDHTQRILDADPLLEIPSRHTVAYETGRVALAANRLDLAVTKLEYAAQALPEHGDTQYTLGLAYQRQGRTELAYDAFERCLSAERPSSARESCRKYATETAPAAPSEEIAP
jgi:tetratricopeptide (TPR) repeat protein